MKQLLINLLLKLYSPLLNRMSLEYLKLEKKINENSAKLGELSKSVDILAAEHLKIKDISKAVYDDVNNLTLKLFEIRRDPEYHKAFAEKPLVSVRIATYNRADKLVNIAIPSVLKQTYQNFEIVVVGDHCTDDTEDRIKQLKDKRIRFYNLPNRVNYPEDRLKKWQAVGVHAKNTAADLAKGTWLATLDDDDEFTPDQLEKLVKHALETRCELVYGAAMRHNLSTSKQESMFSFPPERGKFTFHTAIYMKALDEIFKSDYKSWVLNEVHDWTLCRRMMESGVKISAIEDVVGVIHHVPINNPKKDY